MSIANCFHCGKNLMVRLELANKPSYCAACRTILGLPGPDETPPPAVPQAKTSSSLVASKRRAAAPQVKKYSAVRPKRASNGSSTWLIVGLAGGLVALLLLMLITILVVVVLSDPSGNPTNPGSAQQWPNQPLVQQDPPKPVQQPPVQQPVIQQPPVQQPPVQQPPVQQPDWPPPQRPVRTPPGPVLYVQVTFRVAPLPGAAAPVIAIDEIQAGLANVPGIQVDSIAVGPNTITFRQDPGFDLTAAQAVLTRLRYKVLSTSTRQVRDKKVLPD